MAAEVEAMNKINGEVSPLKEENDWSEVPFWKSQRFLTAVVTFWGFAVLYVERVNLSIAMVCMIKATPTNDTGRENFDLLTGNDSATVGYSLVGGADTNNSNVLGAVGRAAVDVTSQFISTTARALVGDGEETDVCEKMGLETKTSDTGEFTWSKELQGLLLGSFFWGYLVLQVPGGLLSEKYGPRRVVFYTMMPVAVLSLVSPVSARLSPWLFLVVRVLIGVGESSLYPAAQALFARWSPPSERSRLVGFSLSGGQFGNAMIFPIGGLLCSAWGWDSVFYVMGAIGFVWCIVWFFLVYDSPALSKRISPLEKSYILHHVSFREGQKQQKKPWKAIFTSMPFWAILMGHTCGNYGLYMLLTQIPTYMKEVLKFDLKSNGAFSMLPYLTMWLCISLAGFLSDMLIGRQIMSRVWVRKLMSSIGLFGPAICCIGVTFMDCTQQGAAVVLLCGCVGLSGVAFAGYMVNHGDIAPQFAGTLFGITNFSATIPGILAPYIVGAITTNKTREEWQVAFFIASGIYIFGGIFYLVFAQGHLQTWAELPVTNGGNTEAESKHMIDVQPVIDENAV